mmetsp:Transcript_9214/g.19983  ORF Transcript_9214/g.19983 Transcript_9214/m.19983 type:complete len:213 (-) Transcript_9214:172-810(-)
MYHAQYGDPTPPMPRPGRRLSRQTAEEDYETYPDLPNDCQSCRPEEETSPTLGTASTAPIFRLVNDGVETNGGRKSVEVGAKDGGERGGCRDHGRKTTRTGGGPVGTSGVGPHPRRPRGGTPPHLPLPIIDKPPTMPMHTRDVLGGGSSGGREAEDGGGAVGGSEEGEVALLLLISVGSGSGLLLRISFFPSSSATCNAPRRFPRRPEAHSE